MLNKECDELGKNSAYEVKNVWRVLEWDCVTVVSVLVLHSSSSSTVCFGQ